jgi:hypothetical protein
MRSCLPSFSDQMCPMCPWAVSMDSEAEAHLWNNMCVCVHACVCVCVCVCVRRRTCIMYVYMYVPLFVRMYMYVYAWHQNSLISRDHGPLYMYTNRHTYHTWVLSLIQHHPALLHCLPKIIVLTAQPRSGVFASQLALHRCISLKKPRRLRKVRLKSPLHRRASPLRR